MKNLRNTVRLIGRLGMDPEVKELENGRKMARFSLATSETYRDNKGNKITDTQWHQLVAWGKTASFSEEYLKKGKEIAVEGKLVHRNYEDKNGIVKYISEVVVNEIGFVGAAKESA